MGVRLPKKKELRSYFNYNPDGFGVSFQYNGKVRTVKGAMTVNEMFHLLDKVRKLIRPKGIEEIDMVLQWRKAVTGSICRRFCHPFPVTKDQRELDSLDILSDIALAHNGIIWDYNKEGYSNYNFYGCGIGKNYLGDINDAQEFIKDYVFDLGSSLFSPPVQKLIAAYTESKFALLTTKGITYIGKFEQEHGLWYSNMYHKPTGNIQVGNKSWLTYKPSTNYNKYFEDSFVDEEEIKEISEGGIKCDFCQAYVDRLYELPNDDQSLLCSGCFELTQGYKPMVENQVI